MPQDSIFPNTISVEQAARIIRCSQQNIRYLLARGKIRGQKINAKCWAVDLESAREYIREKP